MSDNLPPYSCHYIHDTVRPSGSTTHASWFYAGTFVDGAQNAILQFFVRMHKSEPKEASDRSVMVNLGSNPASAFPYEIGNAEGGFTVLGFVRNGKRDGIMVAIED